MLCTTVWKGCKKIFPEDALQPWLRYHQIYPCFHHQWSKTNGIRSICTGYHHHFPFSARLARDTRTVCIVIPVSLIGAFFRHVPWILYQRVDACSSGGLVGLVVDDAIVATENIYVRLNRVWQSKEVGIEGAKRNILCRYSTTITLVAVFFPIVFMDGMMQTALSGSSVWLFQIGYYIPFCSIDFHTDACYQTGRLIKTWKAELTTVKNRNYSLKEWTAYSRSLAGICEKRWLALPVIAVTIGVIKFTGLYSRVKKWHRWKIVLNRGISTRGSRRRV